MRGERLPSFAVDAAHPPGPGTSVLRLVEVGTNVNAPVLAGEGGTQTDGRNHGVLSFYFGLVSLVW